MIAKVEIPRPDIADVHALLFGFGNEKREQIVECLKARSVREAEARVICKVHSGVKSVIRFWDGNYPNLEEDFEFYRKNGYHVLLGDPAKLPPLTDEERERILATSCMDEALDFLCSKMANKVVVGYTLK